MPVLLVIVLLSCLLLPCRASNQTCNIVDYGAIGDGKTINTQAVLAAVKACYAAGGGTVLVPAGTFVVGQFYLLSNVYIQIDQGGQLYASDDPTQYSCIPSTTTDTGPCNYPVLYANNASNIAIIGPGSINGGANDPPGHLVKEFNATTNYITPIDWTFEGCTSYGSCRPKLVVLTGCTHVVFRDIQLLNSPLWTTTIVECEDVLVEGAYIAGDRRWPNNDGFDPIDSSDIVIRNTTISTGDDCICLVTHSALPIKNVTIYDCTLSSTSAAFKITSFEAGASGDLYDIYMHDVVITDTNRGIAVMPRWGTGNIYNVRIENIVIQTQYFSTNWWGSAEPIYITGINASAEHYWGGKMGNITLANIRAVSENGVVVASFGPPITDLVFDNISITISQFTNYSRPSHDWRPAPGNQMFYAPINGFYLYGADGVELTVRSRSLHPSSHRGAHASTSPSPQHPTFNNEILLVNKHLNVD